MLNCEEIIERVTSFDCDKSKFFHLSVHHAKIVPLLTPKAHEARSFTSSLPHRMNFTGHMLFWMGTLDVNCSLFFTGHMLFWIGTLDANCSLFFPAQRYKTSDTFSLGSVFATLGIV